MHYFARRWPFGNRARGHTSRSAFNLRRRLTFEPLEDRRMLATITVTSMADNLNVDGVVTLREAIHAAEMNVSVDGSTAGSGADTIQFAPGLSGSVDVSIVEDMAVGPSAILVASEITIQGNAQGIAIQRDPGEAEMRLFRVAASGNLTLDSLMLTGGIARGAAGATPGESGGEARGGAVLNEGTLEVVASTLYGNQAIGGNAGSGGNGGSGRGGAIYNNDGEVSIVNSTLSTNSALSGAGGTPLASFGGAVYSLNGSLAIHNSTITIGSATAGRGVYIGVLGGTATAEIYSSIIAQSGPPVGVSDFVAAQEIDGQITVTGANNLIRTQALFHEITVSTDDPLLGGLATNGGPTFTHALLSGSPAINQGGNALSLSTDQRGAAYAPPLAARPTSARSSCKRPPDPRCRATIISTKSSMRLIMSFGGKRWARKSKCFSAPMATATQWSTRPITTCGESTSAKPYPKRPLWTLPNRSQQPQRPTLPRLNLSTIRSRAIAPLAAQSEAFESLAARRCAHTSDSRYFSNTMPNNNPLRDSRVLRTMAYQAQDEALLILLGERMPVDTADDSFGDATVPPTVEADETAETNRSFRREPTSVSAW